MRIALLAAVIGGFAAVAYQDLERARTRAVEDALRQTRNLALTLEADAANTVRSADQAVLALMDSVGEPMAATPPNGQPALGETHPADALPAVRSLLVADATGLVRYASGTLSLASVAGFDLFEAHRDGGNGGVHLSTPFRDGPDGGWRIAVSRRLNEPGGGFGGVAAAVIDLRRFAGFYASLDVGAHGFITLWRNDGAVLATSRRSERLEADPYAMAADIPRFDPALRAHTLTGLSPFDGRNRTGTVRRVEGLPLFVLVRLGADDYLADWRAGLWQRGLETAALSAVLILLAVLLLRHLGRLEHATKALRASERQSQALFNSSFQVMGLLAPDGTVVALNQPACALAGLPPALVIGRPAWEFRGWARDDGIAAQFRQSIETAASGRFVRYETDIVTEDGVRVMDVSIKPIFDEAGAVTLMVIEARDITERKRAEDSLRDSEARLRSYLDAAMEGFFISGERGHFIDVNPAACRALGFSQAEILAMRVSDLVARDHPLSAASLAGFRAVEATGLFRGEMALRRKDGAIVRAEVNAVRLDNGLYLGVTRDVTKRRLAEEALRASTSRLSALVDALPDLVFILDDEGRYRETVASAAHLLACPIEEMLGRRLDEVLPAEAAGILLAALRQTLESGQPQRVEYPLTLAGGPHWFEGRTRTLAPDFGDRPMVLLLSRDITDRVEAAERLAAAKELAEAANQAKGAFLATMSHELRTPLNAIIGFSEIMLHELFGPLGSPRYHEYARHVQNSGRHLLDLINDVLDMSKLEAGRMTLEEGWIDVAGTLESCRALSALSAERGEVFLTVATPFDPPMLFGDERALRQVLLNLLSNAVKFTPPGGRVEVTAGLRASGEEGGREFFIAVRDTGIGIAPEALATIAQPFHQADSSIARRFGGTGLGLSISRELVGLHGGSLNVVSEPGRGTTVTVLFPASRVGRLPVAETAQPA
ncbi:PAS domain S-box protein [Azospirillum doebereinerae]|uniref:histidine kinase n=1 Tax=Azospirillum doebereinerae TaxID=92933 RepID=A0A3S0XJA1_9PROT|nr:PAS domain S-box protein [Azospirillum doebereinerae]MCG5241980.1 PAS domain S-box protein [Azospirillum doebereinerae]RUQ65057.1 PAS domain-containing sensor histidine kinase [Azospirillum doebereinerae]